MAQSESSTNFKDDHYFELGKPQKHLLVRRGGEVLADTQDAVLLKEKAYDHGLLDPVYYIPRSDVRTEFLEAVPDYSTKCPIKGETTYYNVKIGEETFKKAAWTYDKPLADGEPLRDRIAFDDRRFTFESRPKR